MGSAVNDDTVWLNKSTGVFHRDPGCVRLHYPFAPSLTETSRSAAFVAGGRPCFYCHSKAGYRRYPAGRS